MVKLGWVANGHRSGPMTIQNKIVKVVIRLVVHYDDLKQTVSLCMTILILLVLPDTIVLLHSVPLHDYHDTIGLT